MRPSWTPVETLMRPTADEIRAYLVEHFVPLSALVESAGVSESEIQALQAAGCIPGPSYRVTSPDRVGSFVFGETVIPGMGPSGEYYARSVSTWVKAAVKGRQLHALDALGPKFADEFKSELKAVLRARRAWQSGLDFLFAAPGVEHTEAMQKFLDETWRHFLAGTYGVCVRDANTVSVIAEKEILQHQLTLLTQNGAKFTYTRAEWTVVNEVMLAYEAVTMPFAPHEYPRSSRKRLVEDLRARAVVDP